MKFNGNKFKQDQVKRFKALLLSLDSYEKKLDKSLKTGKISEEQFNEAINHVSKQRNSYNEFLNQAEEMLHSNKIKIVAKGE